MASPASAVRQLSARRSASSQALFPGTQASSATTASASRAATVNGPSAKEAENQTIKGDGFRRGAAEKKGEADAVERTGPPRPKHRSPDRRGDAVLDRSQAGEDQEQHGSRRLRRGDRGDLGPQKDQEHRVDSDSGEKSRVHDGSECAACVPTRRFWKAGPGSRTCSTPLQSLQSGESRRPGPCYQPEAGARQGESYVSDPDESAPFGSERSTLVSMGERRFWFFRPSEESG